MANSTVPRSQGQAFIVETQVFLDLMETQKRTSSEVIETMITVRDCIKEQGAHLYENRKDIDQLKDRVTKLEGGQKAVAEGAKPEGPTEAPGSSDGCAMISRLKKFGNKYRCPRCFRNYGPGYILIHLKDLKKPCVAKP